jgi:hypothetical protein
MRWLWIDDILSFERGREIVTLRGIRANDAPMPHHFAARRAGPGEGHPGEPARGVMPASLIIEGCAQSGGILIGEMLGFGERVILAKISRAEFELDAPAPCVLRYRTVLAQLGDTGASTESEVSRQVPGDPRWLPAGRVSLMFSRLDRVNPHAASGTSAVVFGEVFRDLLARAGLGPPGFARASGGGSE